MESKTPSPGQTGTYHRCSIDRQTIGPKDTYPAIITSVVNDSSVDIYVTDDDGQAHALGAVYVLTEGGEPAGPDIPYFVITPQAVANQ